MKKIVRGNDFVMRIPVRKVVGGEQKTFPLPACTDVAVSLVGAYRRVRLEHEVDVADDSLLLARVEGDKIALGSYALEVKGKLFGNDWRSNEYEQVTIVDRNSEADTELGGTDEGEPSVEMDTAIVIFPPTVEMGNLIKDAKQTIADTKEALKNAETKMGDIEQRADTAIGAATTAAENASTQADRAKSTAEKTEQVNAAVETAEQVRTAAESERKTAEAQRKAQSQSTAEAEQARAYAEQQREATLSKTKADCDAAAKKATDAASEATLSKTKADAATANAQAATAEAEKVNATITDANVLEVTGRDGVKKSLDLVEQAEATTIKAELVKKLDKANVVQDLGDAEDKVVSQKVVSNKLNDLGQKAVVRGSLYTEKETKAVTTAKLQGLASTTGTYYVIETPIHVIYKCKGFAYGKVDVCIGFLDKDFKVVKSWSQKDATKDSQGNWCFDVYSDDWEGAYYLRVDNLIVSLEIYKKPERSTIVDYISKVNFETYASSRFTELVGVSSDIRIRVSENYQVDNGGNKRSLYNIKSGSGLLNFKLSANEVKEINSDKLYFYICNKEFAGGQYGYSLSVSDGTNTIKVTSTFKYKNIVRTFSIDFDYYEIDVSTLDKSKPWLFNASFGDAIFGFNKFRKYIRLSNKLWNGRDLWVESNARGLINVFDNWAWVKSDDIPTLNDAIIATKEGGTLMIPKGDYNVSENCTANLTGNGVNDAVTIYKPITIIGDRKTRFVGGKAITSADLYDEENKIYVHSINDAENGYIYTTSIWICQDGTSDEDTTVVPSEMNALYHKRTHRMNMCSRIYRVNSIDSIKSASKPSFYIDTENKKMYFTIKDGTTLEENPVYIGRNPKDDYRHNNDVNLLIGPTHDVTIRNIDFAYGRIHVDGVENCTIENCITYGIPGNASTGFGISPSSKYVKIINCEICGNSADGLNCGSSSIPIGGDFINTDYKGTGMSRAGIFVYMKNCWIHDNSDDGISEHGAGCFIIENSLLEYNGVSGCTVAGSDSNYIGCIFRKNAWRSIERAGFENLSNDNVGHCLVKDCVAIDNYGQADYSLRSMGLNSYTTFQNCKSIRTETEIPSWVSGYNTLNPVGFEVENKSVNHAVLMDCTSNRTIKTKFGSSADVKVFSGDNIAEL